ncbi:hypothetical protein [Kitasatospora sp. NPDC093806]|uniref:hypothetical protein n=1 Tax=Kitasatospora sp. NPDC093806 TaxID=3155075 RepID=UPI00342A0C48
MINRGAVGRVLVWVARVSAVGAWAALAVALWWGFGLGFGIRRPPPGLHTLALTGLGLLWLRVAALWAHALVGRRRRPRVSLTKDAADADAPRARMLSAFAGPVWVRVRLVAVFLLLPLAATLPGVLKEVDGGEAVRALKSAGAAVATATVMGAAEVEEIEDSDGRVSYYHADLDLLLPDGRRVTAWGADTRDEPRPENRVQALWAPSAPESGALVRFGDLSRYTDTGRTVRGERLFLLAFFGVFFLFVLLFATVAPAAALRRLAWRPLAQTALPILATLLFLWIRPLLTGVDIGGRGSIMVAAYGGFAIPLLLLYIGLTVRAHID